MHPSCTHARQAVRAEDSRASEESAARTSVQQRKFDDVGYQEPAAAVNVSCTITVCFGKLLMMYSQPAAVEVSAR